MTNKHTHRRTDSLLAIIASTLLLLVPTISHAGQVCAVDKTVQHLHAYVAHSDLTFIRNSKRYTAQEASEHMRKKSEHFKDKIHTPEDFIRLSATRSMLSGKPYRVIMAQGETVKTAEWLTAELATYRKNNTCEAR